MFCEKCGKENVNNTKFCIYCGQPAVEAPIQNPVTGMPMQGTAPVQNPMAGMPMQGTAPMQNPVMGMPMQSNVPVGNPYMMGVVPPAMPEKKKGGAAKIVIILLIILILIGAGILAFLGVSKAMDKKKADAALQTANELAKEGEYEDAVAYYQQVLDMQSDNKEAIDGLTDTYIAWADEHKEEGRYTEALSVLENTDSRARKKQIKTAVTEVKAAMAASNGSFSDADLTFNNEGEEQKVELNHAIIVYSDVTYYTEYATGNYDEYAAEYATDRGLSLGMSMEDYLSRYNVVEGYAVWELYSGSSNEYTSFAAYNEENPDTMYEDYNNVWLDIGYCKENGEWRQLEDWEVQDTWFCDANFEDYEEVIVFAVNFDTAGTVKGISLEHFSYDDAWAEWQGWAE